MRSFSFCVLVLCLLDLYNVVSYRQERAEVTYYNPKYVSHAQAFTARRGRTETYTTNSTFTNLQAWNNNVTIKIAYKIMQRDVDFSWKVLTCDIVKYKWITEYVTQFSDIPIVCPIKKGRHNFYNLIFPPKNFPLPLPKGATDFGIHAYITKTSEKIIDFSILIHIK